MIQCPSSIGMFTQNSQLKNSDCLGDPIAIQIARVDLDERQIDFVSAGVPKATEKRPRRQ